MDHRLPLYNVELYASARIFALLGLTLADAVISNIESKMRRLDDALTVVVTDWC